MSVYLDYNATAPLRTASAQAMKDFMSLVGNASSVHKFGRDIRARIEEARKSLANCLKVNTDQLIFTSGATEANNTILQGFTGPVVVSATEHASVLQPRGDCLICPVDANGVLQLADLDQLLSNCKKPALVSVMLANNETGVIQPITEIAKIIKKHQSKFHCDAVQALGKVKSDNLMQLADVISVSAHKIGGPQGIGAIVFNKSFPLNAMIRGGGQERRWRGGTENTIGAVGFGAAVRDISEDDLAATKDIRDQIEQEILTYCPEAKIIGAAAERTPNTCNIVMPGVKSETQVMNFDIAGIAVSAGAACSSGKVQTSHVLAAMGLSKAEQECSLRVSLGWQTTAKEATTFVDAWQRIYSRCKELDLN